MFSYNFVKSCQLVKRESCTSRRVADGTAVIAVSIRKYPTSTSYNRRYYAKTGPPNGNSCMFRSDKKRWLAAQKRECAHRLLVLNGTSCFEFQFPIARRNAKLNKVVE